MFPQYHSEDSFLSNSLLGISSTNVNKNPSTISISIKFIGFSKTIYKNRFVEKVDSNLVSVTIRISTLPSIIAFKLVKFVGNWVYV